MRILSIFVFNFLIFTHCNSHFRKLAEEGFYLIMGIMNFKDYIGILFFISIISFSYIPLNYLLFLSLIIIYIWYMHGDFWYRSYLTLHRDIR